MIDKRKSGRQCQALIPVIVNGRECSSLADAGASVTLLHSDIADELGLKLNASSLKATGVTNDSLEIRGEATVTIQVCNDVHRHRLFVVSNISQNMIFPMTRMGYGIGSRATNDVGIAVTPAVDRLVLEDAGASIKTVEGIHNYFQGVA